MNGSCSNCGSSYISFSYRVLEFELPQFELPEYELPKYSGTRSNSGTPVHSVATLFLSLPENEQAACQSIAAVSIFPGMRLMHRSDWNVGWRNLFQGIRIVGMSRWW